MLPLAGQTAAPIGLNFFVNTHGRPWGVIGLKHKHGYLIHTRLPTTDKSSVTIVQN